MLSPVLAEQTGYIARFTREAKVSAALEHPHIVHVYDYGTQQDTSYLVMQLLTGGSLAERMAQRAESEQPLPSPAETADLLFQLASALDYAHSQGVIHRDIKPSNVMFDNQGNAYLVDFGIAKLAEATSALTDSGVLIGTWGYMSPEQWKAEELTPAADQYSLAVMIYSLLTGRMPFDAPTPAGIMHKHLNEKPTPPQFARPDLSEAVTLVLERALAKKASERFPTCTAFAQSYEQAVRGAAGEKTAFFTTPVRRKPAPAQTVGISLSPMSTTVTAAQPFYRSRAGWALLAVVVLLAAAVVFLLLGRNDGGEKKPAIAGAGGSPTIPATSAAIVIVPSETPTGVSGATETPIPSVPLETQIWLDITATAGAAVAFAPSHTPDYTATYQVQMMDAYGTLTASAPTATSMPTDRPTSTTVPTLRPTDTPLPTATKTPLPTATSTLVPTATQTPRPTDTPLPTATRTPKPTTTPRPTSTARPTVTPQAVALLSQDVGVTFRDDFDGSELSYNWVVWNRVPTVDGGQVILDGQNSWDDAIVREGLGSNQGILLLFQYETAPVGEINLEKGDYATDTWRRWGLNRWDVDWEAGINYGTDDTYQSNGVLPLQPNVWYFLLYRVGENGTLQTYVWGKDDPSRYVLALTQTPPGTDWTTGTWDFVFKILQRQGRRGVL